MLGAATGSGASATWGRAQPSPAQPLTPELQQGPWRLRALSPPNTFPKRQAFSESPVCLQPPVQRARWLFSLFFINIIYKDGSSKKAEMRRLGGSGSWLSSCPPGWDSWRPTMSLPPSVPPSEPQASQSPHPCFSQLAAHRQVHPRGKGHINRKPHREEATSFCCS